MIWEFVVFYGHGIPVAFLCVDACILTSLISVENAIQRGGDAAFAYFICSAPFPAINYLIFVSCRSGKHHIAPEEEYKYEECEKKS